MKSGVVVLCRYNSSRLPGKILKEINGKPVLTYILERLTTVVQRDEVVIATSIEDADDPIADYCVENDWACFRGSLENVADRFYQAGTWKGWDFATRINGDNIFVAMEVLRNCLSLARTGEYDLVSNVKGRTYPKGMSVETVRLSHFKMLLLKISGTSDMEHVTSYLYEHLLPTYHFVYNQSCIAAAGVQFAIDSPSDFQWAEQVISKMKSDHTKYDMSEIWGIGPR